MIPTQTFIEFPEFCNTGVKTKPDSAKYAAGFVEADVLPAEWLNYFENKSSVGITDLNRGVSSMETEMNNVLDAAGKTPSESSSDQLVNSIKYLIAQAKAEAILAAHPVGSLYWTESTENPNTTFGGGTWEQIKDKFILAAGDTYSNKATGGSATVTLSVNNLPSHSHTYTPAGSVSVSSHSHGLNNHTHTFTPSGSVTVSSHSHGLNNHTHTFTPVGTVTVSNHSHSLNNHTHTFTPSGSVGETEISYTNSQTSYIGTDTYCIWSGNSSSYSHLSMEGTNFKVTFTLGGEGKVGGNGKWMKISSWDMSHSHTFTGNSGTTGSAGGTTGNTAPTGTFTGSSGTTGGNSGNTAATTPTASFSGTASSTGGNSGSTANTAPSASFTGTQSSTLSTGSGTAISVMPPYEVKYCWKRTA